MFRRRSKPLDTPVTMLLTRARVVPAMAQLFFASLAGEKLTTPSSTLTRTSGLAVMESSPLGPFTLTTSPSRATATPEGSVIGYFAIRDISRKSPGELEHRADDFAAGAFLARLLLGHHALRGRHDRDPESARDRRQLADALVDAAAGFAHPDKLLDDGTAVVVLEGHPDARQVAIIDGLGVVGDVTLVL